jgi:hypothetical protein
VEGGRTSGHVNRWETKRTQSLAAKLRHRVAAVVHEKAKAASLYDVLAVLPPRVSKRVLPLRDTKCDFT